jgi:hypothetical protein
MPGLVPGIHEFEHRKDKTRMAGTSPAMTEIVWLEYLIWVRFQAFSRPFSHP